MKKVLLGSIMFLAGVLSIAIILAGSMVKEWAVNGQYSLYWNLSQYGLMPVVYIFSGIAIVGMIVAIIGVLESNKQ